MAPAMLLTLQMDAYLETERYFCPDKFTYLAVIGHTKVVFFFNESVNTT